MVQPRPFVRFPVGVLLVGVLLLCGGVAGCETDAPETPTDESTADPLTPTFTKEGTLTLVDSSGRPLHKIDVEFAETPAERQQGLMQRRSMDYGKGMLFLFDEPSTRGMWMKNTPMPLDILFLAPDSTVINIAKRTRPFSETSIEPDAPKRFVLEVRAGFADRFNIRPGTRVRWQRTNGAR